MKSKMVKYDVLLCSIVFYDCYMPNIFQVGEEQLEVGKIIKNHRLVISDNLINIYKDYAKKHGLSLNYELFQQWYSMQAGLASSKEMLIHINDKEIETDDIDQAFSIVIKDKLIKKPAVVCGLCSNYPQLHKSLFPIPVMTSSIVCNQDIDNPLRRNVLPFTFVTKQGDAIQYYIDWFRELFNKQKTVYIFNKYAYKEDEFKAMYNYIINQVDYYSSIHIYIDQDKAGTPIEKIIDNNKKLKKLSEEKKSIIYLYTYRPGRKSYHDRRIFLNLSEIVFTEGFSCLLVGNDFRTLKQGHFSISHNSCDVETEMDSLFKQYPDYIEFWNTTKESDEFEV